MQQKVVFITGGTSGIGAASVQECLDFGARVAFAGRSIEEAQIVIEEALGNGYKLNEDIIFVQADTTNEDQMKKAVETIVQQRGTIDCLYANAGTHFVGTLTDTSLEDWERMMKINVTGAFLTLKYTLPVMVKQNRGRVVITASDQALIGKARSSVYGATKGALGQITKSTAIDYAPYNITVNAVCPGTIDTPMARRAAENFAREKFNGDFDKARDDFAHSQPIHRLGTPHEVAKLVRFLLLENDGFVTGSLMSIDGGYVAG